MPSPLGRPVRALPIGPCHHGARKCRLKAGFEWSRSPTVRRAIITGVFVCTVLALSLAMWSASDATSEAPAPAITASPSNDDRLPPALPPHLDAGPQVASAPSVQAIEPEQPEASAPKLADAPPPPPNPPPRGAQYQSPSQPDRREQLARASARVTAPGLCETERKARDALLAQFRRIDWPDASVLIDPALPEAVLERVARALRVARLQSAELADPSTPIASPQIIVYRSLNQMRSVSCVNTSAYGYYDGSIHLSGNPNGGLTELDETLVHEYVHHLLLQQNVRLPTWLTEGTAMLIAHETWWQRPDLGLLPWARSTHLPFETLVPAFAHATDEQMATHLYFQSFLMVEFVRGRGGMAALRQLISALGQSRIAPDDAFSEATTLPPAELDAAFQAWAQSTAR